MLHNELRKDRTYEQEKRIKLHRGGGGRLLTAFTMAEILLSLTIIGVVAAITLPSLTGNINERTWNTQRKALYARFSQAIALMPALNGFGTLDDTTDTAAETFVTAGLAKVLKINNICDSEHLADCGIVSSYIDIHGTKKVMPKTLTEMNSFVTGTGSAQYARNTLAAAFETQNGESIVVYYNPSCLPLEIIRGTSRSYMVNNWFCANFVYDLNGNKGPNTVGKDMGVMTVLSPMDSVVVMPQTAVGYKDELTFDEARKYCNSLDSNARLPILEELVAMHINGQNFLDIPADRNFWSATPRTSTTVWYMYSGGIVNYAEKDDSFLAYCVKR